MGAAEEDAEAGSYLETGDEPEFTVCDVERWEDAGDGLMRVFVASRRGRLRRAEYSFICTPDRLAMNARKCQMFAAEAHNTAVSRRLSAH